MPDPVILVPCPRCTRAMPAEAIPGPCLGWCSLCAEAREIDAVEAKRWVNEEMFTPAQLAVLGRN